MSTKRKQKLSRAENGKIIDHGAYIFTYRSHVTRVLKDIESGTVSEEDFAKLHNFCRMALSLMETAPISQIQAAWRQCEILDFVHKTDETEVVTVEVPTVPQEKVITSLIPASWRKR
jgi:hypothetical protein